MGPHAVSELTPPFKSASGKLEVHQLPSLEDNFIYLLRCTETGQVAAIDGPEAGTALDYCREKGLALSAIFNTHTHWDHIGINKDMAKRGLLSSLRVVGSKISDVPIPGLAEAVGEGDRLRLGDQVGDVFLTEGHMNGHLSFLFEDLLFCGDTLFAGGCGYLFDGPPAKMFRSLKRLAGLHPATKVLCAHEYTQDNLRFAYSLEPGNLALVERIRRVWALRAEGRATVPSTIQDERETNPFLRQGSEELLSNLKALMPKADLSTEGATFAATRALKDRRDYKSIPDSALPL